MNRTLVEKARCMLFHANLQKKLWAEAVGTAAYILNRSPNKALNVSSTNYEDSQVKSQSAGSHSSSVPVPKEVPLSEVENLMPSDKETTGDYVTNDNCHQDSSECETDKGNLDETYVPLRYVNSQYQQNITLRPRNKTKRNNTVTEYAQRKGTDYEEVFSTVVKYSTIRYLISLAARLGLEIDQLDVVSAFLQGDIDVDIYMKQPEL
ncbi:unnamed protein product [Euphydryas editha]|uniref:Reverse transcriptase Ty1/copia-type domain-containing protein n=1 Tax=Euphydryas editha TaxID=104508 RepID=A0AAU9UWX7_EUPED|nr:unnamed protein product [Euphydryas editha]